MIIDSVTIHLDKNYIVFLPNSLLQMLMGASIIKWTKKVLQYTKAMIFLVKCL